MSLGFWTVARGSLGATSRRAVLLAPLLATCGLSQSLADEPSAVELDYKIFLGGLHAMSLTTRLSFDRDAEYRMAVDANTDGFIGSLVDARYRVESEGVTKNAMASPRRFQVVSGQDDDDDGKTVTMTYHDGTAPHVDYVPSHEAPSDPLPADMTTSTVDPPSAMMTLMETLASTGRCDATVKVFDGKRRYNLTSRHSREVELTANRYAPFAGQAVECRVAIERIAGFREGRLAKRYPDEITIFLASVIDQAPPVPVRVHAKNVFGSLRMHLVALRGVAQDTGAARE